MSAVSSLSILLKDSREWLSKHICVGSTAIASASQVRAVLILFLICCCKLLSSLIDDSLETSPQHN
jgi:hypothetical protein